MTLIAPEVRAAAGARRPRRVLAVFAATAALLGGGLLTATAPPASALQPATTARPADTAKAADGRPAGTAKAANAATTAASAPSTPSWLVGYETQNRTTGAYRACTAIRMSRTRLLTSPDCFTGRGDADLVWSYRGGDLYGGTNHPKYRTAPQYDWSSRYDAFAVATPADDSGSGAPVLASTADAALYAPGAKATFFSWAGPNGEGVTRHAHAEQVAILSPATCATMLGGARPAGTFCTLPQDGTSAPDRADQCLGDAGGALVAGGRLIGLSATGATHCVAMDGVRVYTNVTAYRGQMAGWSRDVDMQPDVAGTVTSLERLPYGGYVGFCDTDISGKLSGCAPNLGIAWYAHATFDFFTQAGDLDGDGDGELLARTPGGALYSYSFGYGGGDLDTSPKRWLGNGWNGYVSIFSLRDFNGDGFPDVAARDRSGTLWLYRGDGKGGLGARLRLGTGWNQYNLVTGRGDLSGDGTTDVVARDTAGTLWLYLGNGRGGFAGHVKLGTGFSGYREIVASGDMDDDGRQDLTGRTPGGGVFIINTLSRGGGLAAAKLYAYTYWKPFTRIS
ncbi:VCBS repeat-containing protein [Streptomyces sp. V4-01]|uniref:VCBS repeat-containing protein n=1 Tax=Actinacidiphila polyblastidii TaxID=3110430 RepID=A0ABU7PL37_9ACTN|nr:VCBS repeat-containing protein [Streptomyces sp. V4-01]